MRIDKSQFMTSVIAAILTDVSLVLNEDITQIQPFITGSDLDSFCRLGKAFDRLIIDGHCPAMDDRVTTCLFKHVARRTRGLWILDHSCDPFAVQGIRQLLNVFKKWEGPSRDDTAVLNSFSKRVTRSGCPSLRKHDLSLLRDRISRLLGPVPDLLQLVPRHGPGAVFDRSIADEKWDFEVIPEKLIPLGGVSLFHLNERHWLHDPLHIDKTRYSISRCCVVPKDYRGGRVIAIEPKELQFLQQSLKTYLYKRLERVTCGEIQFNDQMLHRSLLYLSTTASLDLKDASDMVSRRLVKQLVPSDWADLLFSLRSQFCLDAGGSPIPLRAFALMGSALCFPVEALIHYCIVRDIVPNAERVSVYGDDIILPRRYAYDTIEHLSDFGLVPNRSKCCYRTPFKESCGLDLFGTTIVNPVLLRCESIAVASALRLQSQQRELFCRGYYHVSELLLRDILLHVNIPQSPTPTVSELGSETFRLNCRTRFNRKLQRLEGYVPQITKKTRPSSLSGYLGMFAWFCGQYSERVAVTHVNVRYCWTSMKAG